MRQLFLINNRFLVDASTGLLKDKQTGTESRLEPRLVNLLRLLVAKRGEVVSREDITKEIWDDYGNADEGLTQAISYLRKILDDDTKTLIETIPKRGYKLNGTVEEPSRHLSVQKKKYAVWIVWSFIVIIIILASWWVFYYYQDRQATTNPDALKTEKQTQSADQQRKDSGVVNSADKIK